MKIAKIEDLHCDAGWRTFSFLKISTDDGLSGWSEYTEADGSRASPPSSTAWRSR